MYHKRAKVRNDYRCNLNGPKTNSENIHHKNQIQEYEQTAYFILCGAEEVH
jgi:hypothetical protein